MEPSKFYFGFFTVLVMLHVIAMLELIGPRYKKKLTFVAYYAAYFLACGLVLLVCHRLYFGYCNPYATVLAITGGGLRIQQLKFFAASILLMYVPAFALRTVFSRVYSLRDNNRRHRLLHYLLGAFVVMTATGFSYISFNAVNDIVINEICPGNVMTYLDEDGDTQDYIELYNPAYFTCRLEGLFLSNDIYNLRLKELKDLEIAPKGYLLIKLDGKAGSFSISKEGENVYLSNEFSKIVDEYNILSLDFDTSLARIPDGSVNIVRCESTPGYSNDSARLKERVINPPVLSMGTGIYDSEFDLTISADENLRVFYTTDGNIPDESSKEYVGEPIHVYNRSAEANKYASLKKVVSDYHDYEPGEEPVEKAFIVTAVAIDKAGNRSEPVSATYFVGLDELKGKTLVSVVADADRLFGEDGIYMTGTEYDERYEAGEATEEALIFPNFEKRGRNMEVEASVSILDDAGLMTEQNVGLRIYGGGSRGNALKRFSIIARDYYSGSDVIEVPLKNYNRVHSFVLRDGWVGGLCKDIMQGRDVSSLDTTEVVAFVNGEYWYDTNIMEKYDKYYFSHYYGVEKDNVLVYKNEALTEGIDTDNEALEEFLSYPLEHDLSDDAVYEEYISMFDLQSYLDHWCFRMYANDTDAQENNNVIIWRTRKPEEGNPYGDTRWRWAMYDMDAVEMNTSDLFGYDHSYEVNTFEDVPPWGSRAYEESRMFLGLVKNDNFKKAYANNFMDLINSNLKPENVERYLKSRGLDLTWNDSFFKYRPEYAARYMAEKLGLTGSPENLSVAGDGTGGSIVINSVSWDFANGDFAGKYFTDYPVTLTAVPDEGYSFAGWSGDVRSGSESIDYKLKVRDNRLYASFKKDFE